MTGLEYLFFIIGVGVVTFLFVILLGVASGVIEWNFKITMDPSGVSVIWWPKGLSETEATTKAEGMGWMPATTVVIATLKARAVQENRA